MTLFIPKTENMKKILFLFLITFLPLVISGKSRILQDNFKSLQVMVNQQWLSMPVMTLGSSDELNVGFDELSHNYHRLIMHLEPCNPDWTPVEGIFESDWLEGFNDLPIEDYENSLNTTVLYTHYQLQIPNDQCRLRASGNYKLSVIDEDNDNQEVIVVEFRVVEPLMNVGLGITTNTDIDHNGRCQQVSMSVNYNDVRVTRHNEQIQTFVLQNCREDNMKTNIPPTQITPQGLRWEHSRSLIFDAGNEYHKFEVLDPSHATMGLERIYWDEEERHYHAFPILCEPRRNYIYDEDADGSFIIRNSDNIETDNTSDYVYIHYRLKPLRRYEHTSIIIDGYWTTEAADTYKMEYDESQQLYHATILQKLGYYNYQLLMLDADGLTHPLPEEGSFFQTENRYQAFVYFKGVGARSWQLLGYQEVVFK